MTYSEDYGLLHCNIGFLKDYVYMLAERYGDIKTAMRTILNNLRTKNYHIELSEEEYLEERIEEIIKAIENDLRNQLKCRTNNKTH